MPWIIVAALVAWVLLGDREAPPPGRRTCRVVSSGTGMLDGHVVCDDGFVDVVPPGGVISSSYPPGPAPHQQYPTAPVGQGPALQGPSIAAGLHGQQIFAAGRDGSWIATHAPMVESSDNYRRGPVG